MSRTTLRLKTRQDRMVQDFLDIDRCQNATVCVADFDAGIFERATFRDLLAGNVPSTGDCFDLCAGQVRELVTFEVRDNLAVVDDVEIVAGHSFSVRGCAPHMISLFPDPRSSVYGEVPGK